MKLTLHIWRQKSPNHVGRMVQYEHTTVNPHMSFLEMLDVLNEDLIAKGEEPVAFDHDCREGICGSCGFMINGIAHGPQPGNNGLPAPYAPIQRRRRFIPRTLARKSVSGRQGPGRRPQRVRSHYHQRRIRYCLDRQCPGWRITSPSRNRMPTSRWMRRHVSAAALASPPVPMRQRHCLPAQKSAISAFSRRVSPRRAQRALKMVAQVKQEIFGSCTNIGECEAVCPKEIKLEVIARMNRDYLRASWTERPEIARGDD